MIKSIVALSSLALTFGASASYIGVDLSDNHYIEFGEADLQEATEGEGYVAYKVDKNSTDYNKGCIVVNTVEKTFSYTIKNDNAECLYALSEKDLNEELYAVVKWP